MSSLEFTDEYYDRHWSLVEKPSPREEERIRQTISLIPEDVSSILDVGCGDGRVTNRLITQYGRVVGLESNGKALRYVKAEKLIGSVNSLPFPDKSFDLILCCEVLEHLPFKIYPKTVEEIEKVAAKYIIVTVPNSENRKQNSVTCPHCGCVFHAWRHLRSFNSERLKRLFNQFSLQTLQLCLVRKVYPSLLITGAKSIGLLPKSPFPTTALCPQCGYSPLLFSEISLRTGTANKNSLAVRLLRFLARRLAPAKRREAWLLALYQRR